jgi:hypothetical protein
MSDQEKSLAPRTHVEDQDSGIEPTPQDFGFPTSPDVRQMRCWRNQERFLEEFAKCGIISHAAEAAGIKVCNVEYWDSTDTYGFKKRKGWAAQVALGHAEREIYRRAIEGIDHPVIYKGEITGSYKEYSDNLLMFLTKKLDPSYRDNYQVNVDNSQHVAITQVVIEVRDYRQERLEREAIEGSSRELPADGPRPGGEGDKSEDGKR